MNTPASPIDAGRFEWSSLSGLQLGRYAEHYSTLRFIELGLEVYSSQVDDRGIDQLVRYDAGRCLEIQVKSVRNRNATIVAKKHLGSTEAEVSQRLKSGYCMAFFLFEDGAEPEFYLIPGTAWLTPNSLLYDSLSGDKTNGPYFEIRPKKKSQALLDRFRFSRTLVDQIIESVQYFWQNPDDEKSMV